MQLAWACAIKCLSSLVQIVGWDGFDSKGSLADFNEIETQFKISCSLLVNQGRWPDALLRPQEFLKCSFLAVKTAFHIQEKYGGLI